MDSGQAVRAVAALGALAVLIVPNTVHAQAAAPTNRWEVAAVAGYFTADGDDFQGIEDAFGYGGILRARVVKNLSLGVGIHFSNHGLASLSEEIRIRAWYGEARYSLRLDPQVNGYFGLRGGPIDEDITIVHWTANGSFFGVTTGLDWTIAPHLGLEFQVSESALQFGDVRLSDGSVNSGTAANGSSFNVHGALLVRF